ncbi:transporter [Pseudoflavonifractor phocaeensis]|uniref:transporter n=1 Tax=Pseudoflavonifractor phocaeensis TaxID=1870988 RepID=UPI001958498B|nr:transporter [Pseudoflavonifractor phocaeensis]MBM6870689.1 transporter [Pseudoflavonifractor phocaeensis]MBM6939551.1 transporter [Pseudoflavonifractor phocaeensis]
MDSELLKVKIPNIIYRIAQFLEILVSLIVIVAIAISLYAVLVELHIMANSASNVDLLTQFLATAFTVVIGIEFLKMLSRHNMSSVVEVLLFAIARQMVIEHTSAVENLIMVVSIALLFTIRKFLFIPGLDDKKSSSFLKEKAQDTQDNG